MFSLSMTIILLTGFYISPLMACPSEEEVRSMFNYNAQIPQVGVVWDSHAGTKDSWFVLAATPKFADFTPSINILMGTGDRLDRVEKNTAESIDGKCVYHLWYKPNAYKSSLSPKQGPESVTLIPDRCPSSSMIQIFVRAKDNRPKRNDTLVTGPTSTDGWIVSDAPDYLLGYYLERIDFNQLLKVRPSLPRKEDECAYSLDYAPSKYVIEQEWEGIPASPKLVFKKL